MDRFRQIEVFVAVVEKGSFVGAGEALNLSRAAVSKSVLELEKRVGGRLLQRTTRRISLTEAGTAYYRRCKQILDQVDEADQAVGVVTGRAVGRLKVNAPLSFGIQYLAGLWGPFLKQYPELELEIVLSDQLVDVIEDGYDAVIRISKLADSTLIQRRLTSTRLIPCASVEYIEIHGMPLRPEALSRHSTIGYLYGSGRDTWSFISADGNVIDTPTQPSIRANNGDTCKALALSGQGIALLPDFLIWQELQQQKLVPILPEYQVADLGIYIVYPSRKQLSAKVRALIDFLSAAFADPPWLNAN